MAEAPTVKVVAFAHKSLAGAGTGMAKVGVDEADV